MDAPVFILAMVRSLGMRGFQEIILRVIHVARHVTFQNLPGVWHGVVISFMSLIHLCHDGFCYFL